MFGVWDSWVSGMGSSGSNEKRDRQKQDRGKGGYNTACGWYNCDKSGELVVPVRGKQHKELKGKETRNRE